MMTPEAEPRSQSGTDVTPPKARGRATTLIALLALLAGIVLGGWAVSRWFDRDGDEQEAGEQAAIVAPSLNEDGTVAVPGAMAPVRPDGAAMPADARALAARVAQLEDRLARINVQAQAASGNAARAEGLLVAFAARRVLDKGVPLGYIEGQLRLRFAEAQPRAVATIVSAANRPVTLEQLRVELEDLAPALLGGGEDDNLWRAMRREVSQLFVVRAEGEPSPVPSQRLARARRLIDAGRVDIALQEVEAMPGRAAANAWLIDARRFAEARRALDLIETAAILEPMRSGEQGSRMELPTIDPTTIDPAVAAGLLR